MIPAPLLDSLMRLLAWLAERIAEIRERNALRDQAARDQAAFDQAAFDQAAFDQVARDQDPGMAAPLAADPAPAGPDARDGSRGLLAAARRRHPPAIVLPGARADAATAAGYAGARSNPVAMTNITAPWSLRAPGGRDGRPVWHGCAGLALADGAKIRG